MHTIYFGTSRRDVGCRVTYELQACENYIREETTTLSYIHNQIRNELELKLGCGLGLGFGLGLELRKGLGLELGLNM